jgi:eukaryotic-like serine/threonine-protein kinase
LSLDAGVRLGHFVIVGPLGAGGMGEVYKARDTRLDRTVAIKVLPSPLSQDADRRARFDREARAISRLTHPHICTLYDVGHRRGVDFLVMECLEGETLADRLKDGPLPTDLVLKTGIEIGEGLEWAHHEGIIHRDLKPANVMLTRTGAKLLDFGLARMGGGLDSERSESPTRTAEPSLTDPGAVMGTLSYLAPEQIEGKRADARTDIFAFGVILYEMATGKRPFAGTSKASLIGSILRDEPTPVAELAPTAPAALARLIRQCLEKDPDQRRHSIHDTVEELKWIRDGEAGAARPASGPLVMRPGRRAWLVAGAVLGLLVIVATLHPWRKSVGSVPVAPGPTRIAVLPFENLGPPETDYFAEGMSDEVRGKLAGLPGLAVVASTTSAQYRKTTKPIEQVARELDARYLVVGKVRWESPTGTGRLQVIPELVEVEASGAETERWRQPFEATLADVFQVQAEIAEKVARSLDVTLSAGQQRALTYKPTQNVAAYDAFLKGEMAYGRFDDGVADSDRTAASHYEQAVTMDPSFALAWARLSRARSSLYVHSVPTPAAAEAARAAAERAIALAPARPEGYEAKAMYHSYVEEEPTRALPEIERAAHLAPRDLEVVRRLAQIEGDLGRWPDSLLHFQEAREIDPRSTLVADDLADTLVWLRHYPEAEAEADRALALDPGDVWAERNRIEVSLGQGDLAGARRALQAASTRVKPAVLVVSLAELAWLLDDSQQNLLLTLRPDQFGRGPIAWAMSRADVYALRKDAGGVRENAELARLAAEAQLRLTPRDARTNAMHGRALAYLGRKAEAIAAGQHAVELMPATRNASSAPLIQQRLVEIYVLVGENEKAIDGLEGLLKIPSDLSPGRLRIDPTFAPLRGNARFERLIARTE